MAAWYETFGFKVRNSDGKQIPSVIAPSAPDGAVVVDTSVVSGGWQGFAYDIDAVVKSENEQIQKYREIAKQPEVDSAIVDIINEMVVTDQDDYPVKLELDNLKISEGLKKKFNDAFQEILDKLDFNTNGHDICRKWYTDAKIYYHILLENGEVSKGIAELRPIDPLKVKKVRNIIKKKNSRGIDVVDSIEEYYIYNDKGINEQSLQGIKLSADSMVMCHTGNVDPMNGMVVGYLGKAIKPANQLKMLEDAIVIHTITRAPDRRVFYVDVGNLPKIKAEQYVTDIMNKFKNKLVYNAATGEISDSKKNISMIEDFWMPRRGDGKTTEITTLAGSQSLINSDFVDYFQNKLYQSLNVPIGRMKPETGFSLGRSSEITRDELKFNKFIGRLRIKFCSLFQDLMRIQLISKGLIRSEEWEDIKSKIRYDFQRDNHFAELKDAEIISGRMQTLQLVDPYLGKYVSKKWVMKNILRFNDDDIDDIEAEIKKEGEDAMPTEISNQMTMLQIQQDAQQPQIDQQAQQDDDLHQQALAHKEEIHQQRLKEKSK